MPSATGPLGVREDLLLRLRASGPDRDNAVRELRALMLRAARYQVSRMHDVGGRLGRRRLDDIASAAADEATVAALTRLNTFEGRSRFTTWAYKFGILQALVEVRRASWSDREIDLAALGELAAVSPSPEASVETSDFVAAVHEAIDSELTSHQRRIVLALVMEGVPPDVLAERLGSTRNAIYKTLHDARVRLRAHLTRRGYLPEAPSEEVK
ncbi:MAG: RNA polymerase sigma factor [Acidimicrobiales bacterium]